MALPATRLDARHRIGRIWVRPDLWALALVLALQVFYFTGIAASDDVGYVEMIRSMHSGGPVSRSYDYFLARFVHWKLVKLALVLVPAYPGAVALPSMAAMLATLLIIRAFARRHLGLSEKSAAVAVLLCGLVPVCVAAATVALPDTLATALAWAGVFLVATPLLHRDVPRAAWRCLAGGLLIAVGYNAKETVAAFVPGLLLFVAVSRTRSAWAWKRAAMLAAGALVWLIAEAGLFWSLTGDPRLHAHAVASAHQSFQGPTVEMTLPGLLRYWSDYFVWLVDPRADFGPIGPVLLAGLGFAFFRKTDVTRLLLCLIGPAFVFLCAGSTDWRHYNPVIHQSRYLIPLLPAMALLTVWSLRHVWATGGPFRRNALMLGGVAVLAGSLVAPNRLAGRWYQAQAFTAGYEVVRQYLPESPVGPRLTAAGLTANRFSCLPQWLGCPRIERIESPPRTPEEWLARYGGAYVLTSRFDREGAGKAKHAAFTLYGAPLEALGVFERVGRVEPPRDRLSTWKARLFGGPIPTWPDQAVELWRVLPLAGRDPRDPAAGSRRPP